MPSQEFRKYIDRTAIATTTLYNPDIESHRMRQSLASNMIRKASDLGYNISVCDGGSSEEFLKEMEKYGAKIILDKEASMGKSRRTAIYNAMLMSKGAIAWTEPEKESYVSELAKTVIPVIEGQADIAVPMRTSLGSYPEVQRCTELTGNTVWKFLTGEYMDVWFGPRTFNEAIAEQYFLKYGQEYGDSYGDLWDSTFIPVLRAVKDGKKVVSVKVDYTHPPEQTAMEGDQMYAAKRIQQLDNLVSAFFKDWTRAKK